jgi:SAM-dependent methyltransferase
MDLFGKALLDYSEGNHNPLFYNIGTNRFEVDIGHYFRDKEDAFSDCERLIFNKCNGKTLDVGCGTCNYHFLIKTSALGIDNSKYMIKISKGNNAKVILANIYEYSNEQKFDTIILMGNSLGLGGTLGRSIKLLNKLKCLLAPYGQIYIMQKEIEPDYDEIPIVMEYKGKRKKVRWVSFRSDYLAKIAHKSGLKSKIILRKKEHYVVRLTHQHVGNIPKIN